MNIVNIFFIILSHFCMASLGSQGCGKNYGQSLCQFVPAKPGHTPSCAQGSTFCEKTQDYPETVIKTLLKSYKIKDILRDELQSDFKLPIKKPFDAHFFVTHAAASIEQFPETFGEGVDLPFLKNYNANGQRHTNSPRHWQGKRGSYNPDSSSEGSDFRYPKLGFGGYRHHRSARKTDEMIYDEFIKTISPRTKRQVSPNREELCEIRTNFINPQAALNARGNWMYIVNGVDTATQLVKTETCVSNQCSNLCQLPNNYNSRCEQKYVQKRLVALDANGDKLYTDTFWFPSCCVCTLSSN